MKYIVVFCCLVCSVANGQKWEKFYDYQWKPCIPGLARFLTVAENTDSGWRRNDYFIMGGKQQLQMRGLYMDDSCKVTNGSFYYFHPNGKLSSMGKYVYGKKEGLWLGFYSNGKIEDSSTYEHNKLIGIRLRWHSNGYLSDSISRMPDGSLLMVGWFDNGILSYNGSYNNRGKMIGKWIYYHNNGKPSDIELYENGVLQNKQYFTEDGVVLNDTTNKDHCPVFKGGLKAWQNYLSRMLYFPTEYKIVNTDQVVVLTSLMVDISGKVREAEVLVPFHPAFDKIALDAVSRSPTWKPAVEHNRKVPLRMQQAVIFAQQNY